MQNHADPFLEKFYQASIASGTVAAGYKARLITKAVASVIAVLDAGIKYEELFVAVVEAVKERNLKIEPELRRMQKEQEDVK